MLYASVRIKAELCTISFYQYRKIRKKFQVKLLSNFTVISDVYCYKTEPIFTGLGHGKLPPWDVIKWKHFPPYWPFVRGMHRSPVNSPHKGQWRGALMFSLIRVWINGWVNNREAGELRRYLAHYDVRYQAINYANVDQLAVLASETNFLWKCFKIRAFSVKTWKCRLQKISHFVQASKRYRYVVV